MCLKKRKKIDSCNAMETAGAFLKSRRVQKNRSIKDIAEATKISITTLEAIEGARKEFLPPPAYLRGFLKLYALELELDPDEVVTLYEKELLGQQKPGVQKEFLGPGGHPKRGSSLAFAGAVIISIIFIVYVAFKGEKPEVDTNAYKRHEAATTAPAVIQKTDIQSRASEEKLHEGTEPQALPGEAEETITGDNASAVQVDKKNEGGEFTLNFVAREMTWLRIAADEQSPYEIMLKPGSSHRQSAGKSLKVRIGNPGGIILFFNEKSLGVAGEKGNPVDLQFPEAATQLQSAPDTEF
ncbi:MAG: RodZ domain-containing protein [Pseudomonadota bacterium]